jgi:hypothetical protein
MMEAMATDAPPDLQPGPAPDLAAASLALARGFAVGATMWCVAPEWPSHARHVAVEFVHPVIVGKRALPSVSLHGADVTGSLRQLSRPGDILLVVSGSETPGVADLLLRAEAWGVTSLWLGAGARPASSRADHVVWLEDADPVPVTRSGDLVLLYHLLWELTHVVLEHRGLLEPAAPCDADVCITCSDEGRVAEVRSLLNHQQVEVMAGGRVETVDASLVDQPAEGALLLVHAGVALATLEGAMP